MLEVGGIPTLCRNGDSPIQRVKPLEQEQKFSDLRPSLAEQRVFLFMEALAIRSDQPEIPSQRQAEELEAYDDIVTQFSELVDGNMRTCFELRSEDGELYGHDGRAMSEVAQKALNEAKAIAKKQPNLSFEVRRRKLEDDEIAEAKRMSNGEGPNTMVIPSDFPAELEGASEDVGGYNVTRKQTMLRVLARQPDSNIVMYSQSLDGSNRQALEAIYEDFGLQPEPGELLGQRIRADLLPEDQNTLADRLTGVYDRSMASQHGGEWYAGRRPADYRNTYDFVRQQQDIVQTCVNLKLTGELDAKLLYDMAATMQKRFAADKQGVTSITPRIAALDPAMLRHEIELAGAEARQTGRTFSACGGTLRADGLEASTQNELEQAGYGNKTNKNTSYKFDKKMHCVVCQPQPKKNENKKMCGPCGICRDCDKHLSA